jgi:hypothetical protein
MLRTYLELGGDRGLARVAKQFGVLVWDCEKLSRRWSWVARSRAHDSEQLRLEFERKAEQRKSTLEREVKVGQAMQSLGAEILLQYVDKTKAGVSDGRQLIVDGSRLIRLGLGMPADTAAIAVQAQVVQQ